MVAPRISSVSPSTRIRSTPMVSDSSTARLTLLIGTSALSTLRPEARASARPIPTRPSGGSVNMAYVGTRPSTERGGSSRIWASW